MNNDFFINEEYRNYIESLNDDIKSAFITEFTEKKSENKDKLLHDKIFDEAWELENRPDIEENRKLLGITLFDDFAPVLTLPMSVIEDLFMADIKVNHMEFSCIRDEYKYHKNFFCGCFSLYVKKDKLTEFMTNRLLTLPDIVGVDLIYENQPNEYYFLQSAYEKGKEPLLLEAEEEDDFDGVYSNNLCQMVGECSWDDSQLQLSIRESNIPRNKRN